MIFVFYFFAALLVLLSIKSVRDGFKYLAYFRREIESPMPGFAPFVSVFAPCRGLDDGLRENLLSLLNQDFPAYEVIFVVDDVNDPAASVIKDLSGEGVPTKLVVAPKAAGCSQKVANLREAVLHADAGSEVFVFVDSDTRPGPHWLRRIIAPLEDETSGAATGYRWFLSDAPTFASEMRSVWNASIASALGPDSASNFCWGGSMAIRRSTFDRIEMREKWSGTLSDDFAVTRAMKAAGLPIVFVPQAMTASLDRCTVREMLEFTTRQMKITRVYATPLWLLSFFGSALYAGVLTASFALVLFRRQNDLAVLVSVASIVLVSVLSSAKAWLRLEAVKLALPQYKEHLDRQRLTQTTLWTLSPAVFLYNSVAALLSRRMTWRGIRYELKSPTETVIIAP